jgi:hypothetical protein
MYLVDFQGSAEWHGKLKGLWQEMGWAKTAENLDSSFSKRDMSDDATFSRLPLAGRSLKQRHKC